jgi:hypothetical protein
MVEPPPGVRSTGGVDASLEDARSARLSSLNLDVFLTLIAPAALLGATAGAMAFVAQTSGETNPGRMTMLVAVITLAEAMGAAVAARLAPSVRSQMVLVGLGAVVAVAGLALRAWFVPAVIRALVAARHRGAAACRRDPARRRGSRPRARRLGRQRLRQGRGDDRAGRRRALPRRR